MIPAVLSCLFVIYLYISLNRTADDNASSAVESGNDPSDGKAQSSADTRRLDLLQRLDQAVGRVKKLAEQTREKGR